MSVRARVVAVLSARKSRGVPWWEGRSLHLPSQALGIPQLNNKSLGCWWLSRAPFCLLISSPPALRGKLARYLHLEAGVWAMLLPSCSKSLSVH